MDRFEFRLAGSGGQGLILAGVIIAEAAVMEGKNAVQTQSYGAASRGGSSMSEVVISDGEIDFPEALNPDVFLSMTQQSYELYYKEVKEDGIIVVDSDLVKDVKDTEVKVVNVPITRIARDVGKAIVANIVAIGVLTSLTNVVDKEIVEKAVLARVPKGTEILNRKALQAGFESVR
jgi:2-oxoglutarate ferredoxin oxidoreductase subunit gamma